MNDHIQAFYELEKIVIYSGKIKEYLKDIIDTKSLSFEQFRDSVIKLNENVLERDHVLFKKIMVASTEKILSIREQNFEYATAMRVAEWNALEEVAQAGISKLFFKMNNNIGYYFLYTN